MTQKHQWITTKAGASLISSYAVGMKKLGLFTLVGALVPLLSMSQTEIISQSEADAALQAAVQTYAQDKTPAVSGPQASADFNTGDSVQVWHAIGNSSIPDITHPHYNGGANAADVDLNTLQLRVDLENMTLSNALFNVVNKIGDETGPWQLRWRLKPENINVKEEVVNLIAEASFGEFIAYLSDRVKNMTGIQLFVSVFDGARVIVISDTYN